MLLTNTVSEFQSYHRLGFTDGLSLTDCENLFRRCLVRGAAPADINRFRFERTESLVEIDGSVLRVLKTDHPDMKTIDLHPIVRHANRAICLLIHELL